MSQGTSRWGSRAGGTGGLEDGFVSNRRPKCCALSKTKLQCDAARLAANAPERRRLVLSGTDGNVFGLRQEFACKIKDGDGSALCDKRDAVMGRICAGVGEF
jgi:hypothetical protein